MLEFNNGNVFQTDKCSFGDKIHFVPNGFTYGWVYVQVIGVLLQGEYSSYINKENYAFDSIYHVYLNASELILMLYDERLSVYYKEKAIIGLEKNEGSSIYLIRATNDWKLDNNKTITRKFFNYYQVHGDIDINQVLSDPRVSDVHVLPTPQLINRFSKGFVQIGSQIAKLINGSIITPKLVHDMGLTGKDQVICVSDTGVDVFHPFFYDPNVPFVYNVNLMNHRKIVRYESAADYKDIENGHGTHVAGTIAGKSLYENSYDSLFDGHAPDARLFVYDMWYLNGNNVGFDAIYAAEMSMEIGGYISSGSWGSDYQSMEATWYYQGVASLFPDFLYVYAAGNTGKSQSILSPASSRNVLAVGATTRPALAWLLDSYGRITVGETSSKSVTLNLISTSATPTQFENLYPRKSISNQTLVNYSEGFDLSSKVVLFPNNTNICSAALDSQNRNCSAFLFLSDQSIVCSESFDILVGYTTAASFEHFYNSESLSIFDFPTNTERTISLTYFSSRGPTLDNYLKPEIVLPGELIYSARAGNPSIENMRTNLDQLLSVKSGTSMATPAASALISIIRQFCTEGWYHNLSKNISSGFVPSSALMRALIIASARPLVIGNTKPNNEYGFGLPNLLNVFPFFKGGMRLVNNAAIPTNSHVSTSIFTENTDLDLCIVIAYLDPVLNQPSVSPLVLDLDLIVVSPSGNIYYGNEMPTETDNFNTNERVLILAKDVEIGEYKIHVFSNNCQFNESFDFSIVVTGPFIHKNISLNPFDLGVFASVSDCDLNCNFGQCSNGLCQCDKDHTGVLCNLEWIKFSMNTPVTIYIEPGHLYYYYIDCTNSDQSVHNITIDSLSTSTSYFVMGVSTIPFKKVTDKQVSMVRFNSIISGTLSGSQFYFVFYANNIDTVSLRLHIKSSIPRTPVITPQHTPLATESNTPHISPELTISETLAQSVSPTLENTLNPTIKESPCFTLYATYERTFIVSETVKYSTFEATQSPSSIRTPIISPENTIFRSEVLTPEASYHITPEDTKEKTPCVTSLMTMMITDAMSVENSPVQTLEPTICESPNQPPSNSIDITNHILEQSSSSDSIDNQDNSNNNSIMFVASIAIVVAALTIGYVIFNIKTKSNESSELEAAYTDGSSVESI